MFLAPGIIGGFVGACAGSFVGTAALRTLRSEQPWVGRSHCDSCGVPLGMASTVPIVSYVSVGGACRSCGSPIDRTHLAVELAGAVVGGLPFLWLEATRAALVALLGLVLLASSVIDAKVKRLPDGLTAACLALTMVLAVSHGWRPLATGAIASGCAFAMLQFLRTVFARVAGEAGLGFGDVKLAAVLAVWLGLGISWAVTAASLAGLSWVMLRRPRSRTIPFGPFLAAAGWIVGLAEEVYRWPGLS